MICSPFSRRACLRGVATGTASLAFAHLEITRARASDLALSDRIELLYSNQFHFNRRGEPQITVGLVHGRTSVTLRANGGLLALPSGDGGTAIEGAERFNVALERATVADQHFAVVLEEIVGNHAQTIESAAKKWRARGVEVAEREVGTVFGVRGQVLDGRRTLLTTGTFSSERQARVQGEAIKRLGGLGKLHPLHTRRNTGWMVASDVAHGVDIRAEGVLWFAPRRKGQAVELLDPDGQTRRYHGSLYVAIDRHGKLCVANLVSETHVLSGLLPAEIFATAPMEALKAQAIAARGQLVAKVGTRHLADPFLLCADQHCQVYAGQHREHPRTTSAVEQTAGKVALRAGGTQLVDTVYSANCGGHSEDNDAVWPSRPDPQLRARPDPLVGAEFRRGIDAENIEAWLTTAPRSFSRPPGPDERGVYRWEATVDPAVFAKDARFGARIGPLRHFEVLRRGRSGRALAVRAIGERGSVELEGELNIRRALGGLKSSMFVVATQRDRYGRFVLRGGGHGHGVGLCQHGAMGMAKSGHLHEQILSHYYSGCELAKLW